MMQMSVVDTFLEFNVVVIDGCFVDGSMRVRVCFVMREDRGKSVHCFLQIIACSTGVLMRKAT